jgi:hypothetical protein
MTIRKIPRGSGARRVAQALCVDRSAPRRWRGLAGPARIDEVLDRMKTGVSTSVQTASPLHGLRVEALLRAMLVALRGFMLLTDVDGGELHLLRRFRRPGEAPRLLPRGPSAAAVEGTRRADQ